MNVIFLGPPGAGKGTQATVIAAKKNIVALSTGDMLRAAVKAGTPIGKRAKAVMDSGKLVSDEIVIGIIKDRIAEADCKAGFILDGFPRTLAQAAALDKLLAAMGRKLDQVIEFKVDDGALLSRIEKRAKDALAAGDKPRADDNADALKTRLWAYYKETAPLIGYYFKSGNLISIDGLAPVEKVTGEIEKALK
ncbi:MAG: adenylate kinase [Hyphomicrobiaceae bacterium]